MLKKTYNKPLKKDRWYGEPREVRLPSIPRQRLSYQASIKKRQSRHKSRRQSVQDRRDRDHQQIRLYWMAKQRYALSYKTQILKLPKTGQQYYPDYDRQSHDSHRLGDNRKTWYEQSNRFVLGVRAYYIRKLKVHLKTLMEKDKRYRRAQRIVNDPDFQRRNDRRASEVIPALRAYGGIFGINTLAKATARYKFLTNVTARTYKTGLIDMNDDEMIQSLGVLEDFLNGLKICDLLRNRLDVIWYNNMPLKRDCSPRHDWDMVFREAHLPYPVTQNSKFIGAFNSEYTVWEPYVHVHTRSGGFVHTAQRDQAIRDGLMARSGNWFQKNSLMYVSPLYARDSTSAAYYWDRKFPQQRRRSAYFWEAYSSKLISAQYDQESQILPQTFHRTNLYRMTQLVSQDNILSGKERHLRQDVPTQAQDVELDYPWEVWEDEDFVPHKFHFYPSQEPYYALERDEVAIDAMELKLETYVEHHLLKPNFQPYPVVYSKPEKLFQSEVPLTVISQPVRDITEYNPQGVGYWVVEEEYDPLSQLWFSCDADEEEPEVSLDEVIDSLGMSSLSNSPKQESLKVYSRSDRDQDFEEEYDTDITGYSMRDPNSLYDFALSEEDQASSERSSQREWGLKGERVRPVHTKTKVWLETIYDQNPTLHELRGYRQDNVQPTPSGFPRFIEGMQYVMIPHDNQYNLKVEDFILPPLPVVESSRVVVNNNQANGQQDRGHPEYKISLLVRANMAVMGIMYMLL